MQATDEDAVFDQRGVLGGRAFVVEGRGASQPGHRAVVPDVEHRLSEATPQRHHLARLGILIHEVGLREVPERLVDEHAAELGVEHHGVGAALDAGRVEQRDGPLGDGPEAGLPSLRGVPALAVAQRLQPLLDHAVPPGDGRPREHDFGAQLVDERAFRVRVPDLADLVAVARLGVDDAVADGEHRAVVRLEQALLLGEGDAPHVAVQVEDGVGFAGEDLGEADRGVEAHGAGQLAGAGHHGGEPVQGSERRDPPAAAFVQDAHEAADVLARGRGLEAAAPERDGGAPRPLDADFAVIGSGRLQRVAETILHWPSSRSFSA